MSDVKWHRVFAVSSLIMAFLLIAVSIYLHVQQKHHFGRLRHDTHRKTNIKEPEMNTDFDAAAVQALTAIQALSIATEELQEETTTEVNSVTSSNIIDNSSMSNTTSTTTGYVSEACLQCICETSTECHPAICGGQVPCGLFRISKFYWLDAGKPKLNEDIDLSTEDNLAYSKCINNVICAKRTVDAYMRRYAKDCNHDGVIDCQDHVTLHILGPSGCVQKPMPPIFQSKMEKCLFSKV